MMITMHHRRPNNFTPQTPIPPAFYTCKAVDWREKNGISQFTSIGTRTVNHHSSQTAGKLKLQFVTQLFIHLHTQVIPHIIGVEHNVLLIIPRITQIITQCGIRSSCYTNVIALFESGVSIYFILPVRAFYRTINIAVVPTSIHRINATGQRGARIKFFLITVVFVR